MKIEHSNKFVLCAGVVRSVSIDCHCLVEDFPFLHPWIKQKCFIETVSVRWQWLSEIFRIIVLGITLQGTAAELIESEHPNNKSPPPTCIGGGGGERDAILCH